MAKKMFKNLQRQLAQLEKLNQISVPIERDTEGFVDKECPSIECLYNFKIHGDDWTGIVKDEQVFCPSCRHEAIATSWYTTAQVEAAKEYAINKIKNDLSNAMRADAAASKRVQKRGAFISLTLDVKGGRNSVLLPVSSVEPMRLRMKCETCGCRYSFIGAAYFCPCCGINSASHTFAQTLNTIRTTAGIGQVLQDTLSADEAQNIFRSLLEKAMQDAVMSFQRFNEQLYHQHCGKSFRQNAFQRLDDASELWKLEIGQSFSDLLEFAKLEKLKIYFQQRHILAHQQGIVDQKYIDHSGDRTYVIGQRISIRETSVREFADIVEELCMNINSLTKP
jgi:hypothetical protein